MTEKQRVYFVIDMKSFLHYCIFGEDYENIIVYSSKELFNALYVAPIFPAILA